MATASDNLVQVMKDLQQLIVGNRKNEALKLAQNIQSRLNPYSLEAQKENAMVAAYVAEVIKALSPQPVPGKKPINKKSVLKPTYDYMAADADWTLMEEIRQIYAKISSIPKEMRNTEWRDTVTNTAEQALTNADRMLTEMSDLVIKYTKAPICKAVQDGFKAILAMIPTPADAKKAVAKPTYKQYLKATVEEAAAKCNVTLTTGYDRLFQEINQPQIDTNQLRGLVRDNILNIATQPECQLLTNLIQKAVCIIAALELRAKCNQLSGIQQDSGLDRVTRNLNTQLTQAFGDRFGAYNVDANHPEPSAPPPGYNDPSYTLRNPFSTTPTPGK